MPHRPSIPPRSFPMERVAPDPMFIEAPPTSPSGDSLNSVSRLPAIVRTKRKRSNLHPRFFNRPQSDEEYLAFCLLALARDRSFFFSRILPSNLDHKCSICGKSFSSYQALGGHKTSHRKPNVVAASVDSDRISSGSGERKGHQCLICLKTFETGQALGGHKRRHFDGNIGSAAGAGSAASSSSGAESSGIRVFGFDLNMQPAKESGGEIGKLCHGLENAEAAESPLPFERPHIQITT